MLLNFLKIKVIAKITRVNMFGAIFSCGLIRRAVL